MSSQISRIFFQYLFDRYGYAVSDDQGLDFTQQETSEAGVVTGSYSVALPDGRVQTVKYSVGPDTGYVVSKGLTETEYCGATGLA